MFKAPFNCRQTLHDWVKKGAYLRLVAQRNSKEARHLVNDDSEPEACDENQESDSGEDAEGGIQGSVSRLNSAKR